MIKNIVFTLLISTFSFGQELTNKDLIGIWETNEVIVNTKMFKDAETNKIRTVENGFKGAQFIFAKNGLMKISLSNQAPEPFNGDMFKGVYYYTISDNIINIGTRKKASNIMQITVVKLKNGINLDLVGVQLKAERIGDAPKLKISKTKNKAIVTQTKPLLFENINEKDIVDYGVLDEIPLTPDCVNDTDDQITCNSRSIGRFVIRKFNTDLAASEEDTNIITIKTFFVINKEGEIVNITVEAPNKVLQDEAKRVINLLPRFKPAIHKGLSVYTKYSLPIKFQTHN